MIRSLCFSFAILSVAVTAGCGGVAHLGSDDGGTTPSEGGALDTKPTCKREAYDPETCLDNCGQAVQGCTPTVAEGGSHGCEPEVYDPATCLDNCGVKVVGCTPGASAEGGACKAEIFDPVTCLDNCGVAVSGCTPASSGSDAGDASPTTACAVPVLGASCSNETTPCSQPANPCEAGYIWSCNAAGNWAQELIQCTESDRMTPRTTPCGADEVLFVDDAAGDPCNLGVDAGLGSGSGSGEGNGTCPNGSYLFEPNCCYVATDAFCVSKPASCRAGLSCGCAESICTTSCGGSGPGIYCQTAIDSVVDCFCGKA